MKKTWIVMGMLAALACTACDDGDKELSSCTSSMNYCSSNNSRILCVNNHLVESACPGNQTCSGNGVCSDPIECSSSEQATCETDATTGTVSVKYCANGYTRYETCRSGFTCATGGSRGAYCLDNTLICDENTTVGRCDVDGIHQVCQKDSAGVYKWTNAHCTDGQTCSNGNCVLGQACTTDGETRCTQDGIHQTCKSNGTNLVWADSPCGSTEYCEAGKCKAEDHTCISGDKRCGAGRAVQVCNNGVWANSGVVCNQSGANACNAGACVDASTLGDVTKYLDNEYKGYNNGGSNNNGGSDSSDATTCKELCISEKGEGYDAYCPDGEDTVECLNEKPESGYEYCGNYTCGSSSSMSCDEACVSTKGTGYKAYCAEGKNTVECFTEAPASGYEYCGTYTCS